MMKTPALQLFLWLIARRRAVRQPFAKLRYLVREAPVFEYLNGSGAQGADRRVGTVGGAVFHKPGFEIFSGGIILKRVFEQFTFDGDADGVGRRVALAPFSPPFGRLQRSEESAANFRGAWAADIHAPLAQRPPKGLGAFSWSAES